MIPLLISAVILGTFILAKSSVYIVEKHISTSVVKCLWDNDCATNSASCELGTYCYVAPSGFWSQCQELFPGNSGCYVTNEGPFDGARWGCEVDVDCCNEHASCVISNGNSRGICQLQCSTGITNAPAGPA